MRPHHNDKDAQVIKILLIKDSPALVKVIQDQLALVKEGSFHIHVVKSLEEGCQALVEGNFDVILLDLDLPDSQGLPTLLCLQKYSAGIPIVVFTSIDDVDVAIQALHRGAQDYLVTQDVTVHSLMRTIFYAIERKKMSLIQSLKNELERKNRELKEMDEMKSEFISKVSHEMRTPLTIVQCSVANLRDGILGKLTKKQDKVIDIALHHIQRLTKIINNLLDLSRLESGKSKIIRHRASIAEILQKEMKGFEHLIGSKSLLVQLQLPDKIPDIFVNENMIAQVLDNLIDNALHFAKKHVRLSIQPQVRDKMIRVTIGDDGPGIPPEDQSKLFSKFEQLGRPYGGSGYKGTGLGLIICKEIIEKHQGKIWVESQEGQGTEVHFLLPQYDEERCFSSLFLDEKVISEARETSFAVLVFVIDNMQMIQERCAKKDINKAFSDIREQVQQKALRTKDTLFYFDLHHYMLTLAETDLPGAQSLARRIFKVIQACLIKDAKGRPIVPQWRCGISVFPGDAMEEKALIDIALKNAQEKNVLGPVVRKKRAHK
ncbi:MAG: hypothetical protein A3I75_04085 [Deltaproteobacteria bacterium RIFCSPLOWO2_02_FULL_50_16]|nr:MAG: hypothetical protein A2053_03135 [Deltaproteobacteria bacterium GWA2_50_8]OGQ27674.1 MAG: hypothetical protein A3B79_07745 [Deltaproteobacteria bacterium RIFCSPHIGHO2_02_FULL_50_15]OGQ55739.1 MAG: hypothetical protein A3I75_04085 [Deltaproteobacteria bacterium RIFCSPLOWO2_02_FULL_50_16]